jgi:hypothetical protein
VPIVGGRGVQPRPARVVRFVALRTSANRSTLSRVCDGGHQTVQI